MGRGFTLGGRNKRAESQAADSRTEDAFAACATGGHRHIKGMKTVTAYGAKYLLSCWLSLSAVGAAFAADDWPMFHHDPALLGVAEGKLPEKLTLGWKFKTEGPVKSSPAIVGGRVYFGSDDGKMYAVDVANGKKVWEYATTNATESSPLVLDDTVYFGNSDAFLYALKASDGTLKWKYETGDRILGGPNWTPSADGKSKWIIVGSYDFKLHCVDAATGKVMWTHETGNYINGTPAIGDGVAVFGGCDAILHQVSMADGKLVKNVEAGAYIAGSAAIKNGVAYFGHYENVFLAIDLKAGRTNWTYKDKSFPYFSTPAISGNQVVFGGRDKRVHCLEVSTGKPLWAFATRGKVDSSPAICGDKVVVGSEDGRVYLLSLSGGKELWNYEIGQPVTSSPAVARGQVAIGAEDGFVYLFK